MSSSQNRAVSWKLLAVLAALGMFIFAFVVNQGWLNNEVRRERILNREVLGTSTAIDAENRGARWFATLFQNSGILDASYSAVDFTAVDPDSVIDLTPLDTAKNWFAQRVQVIWTMLLQLFIRISTCLLWWQYGILVGLPFVVDALVVRRIKSANFRMASPHAFKLSYLTITGAPFVIALLLFAPFVLSPRLMPAMILILSFALWNGICQFAKRA